MSRILTGIQSSGSPHLGNILGAILPALALTRTEKEPAFFFIADLHTLTSLQDSRLRAAYAHKTAAAWLSCGLDTEKDCFYRQSDIPEVCELTWYLASLTPYPMLANAHAFKDKAAHLGQVNAALFTYPVLMAADILLYHATHVPVGKDQRQHLEITRDIASHFNHTYAPLFPLPEPVIPESLPAIPGTDGRKMSKSYGNTIDPFAPEEELRAQVMSIQTDSLSLAAAKDPDQCRIMALYRLAAPPEAVQDLEARYRAGGYGYNAAKKALLACLLEKFAEPRHLCQELLARPARLEELLHAGADKVRPIARETLRQVREALCYAPATSP